MKLYRKILAGLLALSMMSTLMVGCSSDSSDDTQSDTTNSADSSSDTDDTSDSDGTDEEDNTAQELPDNLDYTDEITDGVVMSINGIDIDVEEYRYYFLNIKEQYDSGDESYWEGEEIAEVTDEDGNVTTEAQTAEENAREKLSTLKSHVLNILINNYCVDMLAEENNVELTADEITEVENSYEETKEAYESEDGMEYDTFEDYLTSTYCNKDLYLKMMRRRFLEEKVIKVLYEEDFRENLLPQYYHCEHILFSTLNLQVETETAADDATEEEQEAIDAKNQEAQDNAKAAIKATAEDVLQQIRDGADFDEMLAEYNEDPGETVNEDGSVEGYYFKEGTMVTEFEDAFMALGDNEISDVVETDYGYHIIKRIPITDDDEYINENLISLIMQDMNTGETTDYYDQYMTLADDACNSMDIDYKDLYYNINGFSLPYQSSVYPYVEPNDTDAE